jgi:hypothetical protein
MRIDKPLQIVNFLLLVLIAVACNQKESATKVLKNNYSPNAKLSSLFAGHELSASLTKQLDSIYDLDQTDRQKLMLLIKKDGLRSKKVRNLWSKIEELDAVNLLEVKSILDQYGWLGVEAIGKKGNAALFLVIQHADQQTREKYLPMMRTAAKQNRAALSDLALLEDRLALEQGKKQLYGSQMGFNEKTQRYYVLPIEKPEHVDERRKSMGLSDMKSHLSNWGIDRN